ncbi:MAG: hypothetical protein ACJ790_15745 [Myxococcaceae bacterium]
MCGGSRVGMGREHEGAHGCRHAERKRHAQAALIPGALTLVTMPEAEVFRNGTSLGKTPLFRLPMPVGVHLLKLKGRARNFCCAKLPSASDPFPRSFRKPRVASITIRSAPKWPRSATEMPNP